MVILLQLTCYALHEISSKEHNSLKCIKIVVKYSPVVSPFLSITYKCSQRDVHMKNSNGSYLP